MTLKKEKLWKDERNCNRMTSFNEMAQVCHSKAEMGGKMVKKKTYYTVQVEAEQRLFVD